MMLSVLIVDDEERIRISLSGMLSDEGFSTQVCAAGEECLRLLDENSFDLVILDVMLPGRDGLDILREIRGKHADVRVIMMSGQADLAMAVEATKLGAVDFFEKPLNGDRVLLALKNLDERIALERRLSSLRQRIDFRSRIIGNTKVMKELIDQIDKAAPTDSRVLITGENGTGKELVARAIHGASGRKEGPFVSLNCAAIPAELIESELFGHEKGAFTGAIKAKAGHFEMADGGTLLLDEVGDLSAAAQAKLLRVLEEREARRVGGTATYRFDVRVIGATNKNLADEIAAGRFREDLFYRLNVIPMKVPSLREHIEDVPLLAEYFLDDLAAHTAAGRKILSSEAARALEDYYWPGNVRELRNTLERLVIFTDGDTIESEDIRRLLPLERTAPAATQAVSGSGGSFREQMDAFEKKLLRTELTRCEGNVSRLARELKMDRAFLHRKLKSLGLR